MQSDVLVKELNSSRLYQKTAVCDDWTADELKSQNKRKLKSVKPNRNNTVSAQMRWNNALQSAEFTAGYELLLVAIL